MVEFLESYGIWIFFGLMLLLMFRGRGRGMGCCGGGHQHDPEKVKCEDHPEPGKSRSGGWHWQGEDESNMHVAVSGGGTLAWNVELSRTRVGAFLVKPCLQFMERDHNRSGTLHYDIQSLVDKLSHEAKDCR